MFRLSFFNILALCTALYILPKCHAEEMPPEFDHFPSRLHAVVYRNWDIVPRERVAKVLQTEVSKIEKLGKELGLAKPKPLTPEEIRRNVELVLRRNWPLLPRRQIEELLGMSANEVDDFLNKEIFLRALLAGQPAGLTLLKYEAPSEVAKTRAKWFASNVKRHLRNVSDTPEEPRLGFMNELCRAHNPADYVPGTKPKEGEIDLRSGLNIVWLTKPWKSPTEFAQHAIEDFSEYCRKVQKIRNVKSVKVPVETLFERRRNTLELKIDADLPDESYILNIGQIAKFAAYEFGKRRLSLAAGSDLGLARGLVELERRMAERGGPFLAPCHETNSPAFKTRYVSSYFSLMTDVLGQDLVDPFPDAYLNELFHQDADGVWVYALLEDLVPSAVFPEIRVPGSEQRLERLRKLGERAAKHGLKVYIYLNEPRDQPLSFFAKYPDIKGHVEGGRAMLCTSTESVRNHLRRAFEKLFREVPGLGGVFVITASENWTNCYSRTRKTNCMRCDKRDPADVIAEVARCMAEGSWAANPQAKFIVWDWSWHAVLGEDAPARIIEKLPKGISLMADWERGTPINRGGVPMNVEEYSISIVGPSARAKLRSEQAAKSDFEFLAKIQLSTTWECGTVPFIPVPNLLSRKAQAMRDAEADGAMATWTIGSYPSPNTEAFALKNWHSHLSEVEVLRKIAARRYGSEAAESAVRGWTKLSQAFTEEFPFFGSYAPPLQHGPSLPLYRRDIPPPYGNATLFNCKDDWRNWPAPFPPETMSKLLNHLCDRWDEGVNDLREVIQKAPKERRKQAERDLGVAWMVGYHWRAYANNLDFYQARDSKNAAEMKRVAELEMKHTTEAFRLVRSDSRLGWEAELQYFYRPLDVLERLISLDAVITPQNN